MEVNIKLDRRKSERGPKGYPIVIQVSKNYQQRRWRTGHWAKGSEWNENRGRPNKKHPDYYVLLDVLDGFKGRIDNVVRLDSKKSVSIVEAKKLLFKKDFVRFFDAAMDSFEQDYRGTDWSAVKSFNKHFPLLGFDEITSEMVTEFIGIRLRDGNKPAGVDSYIRSLKAVWNRLTDLPNPFKGHKIEIPDTENEVASKKDIKKLKLFIRDPKLFDRKNKRFYKIRLSKGSGGFVNYAKYWLLMFYLGGIDPEVLAKLRYDRNVRNGRAIFNRDKGRSKTACNNIIPKEALEILRDFDCRPYLVPIFKSGNYDTFSTNFSERMKVLSEKLELSARLRPKGARYTFIDRAQQLLIDERITAQIVGHKRRSTTSIYTNDFPRKTQDAAHLKIIDLKQKSQV